ncbi:chromatin assembly factor 1 subunit A-like isoform X3 [Mytilus edulis]|uniref:chromatin assembly factor 1 subunit A-like isoform X1 n=1 Tax=Mytilus edulis TaxID=6550 RepID=UPI0039F0C913
MAQVECVQNVSNGPSADDDDGCTPSKKLRQARLPFKTIEHKAQLVSPKSTAASKKRKLSDAESPSAKAPKTPKSGTPCGSGNAPITSGEAEVSSSSEADNVKIRVRNTLERFVRKNSQEEITSSTNIECIDITDSDDGKESDVSFVDTNTCQSKKIKEFFSVKESSKTVKSKEENSTNETQKVENYIQIIEAVSKGLIPVENSSETCENKENLGSSKKGEILDVSADKENMDVSDESTSLSDMNNSAIDPVTPGKGSVPSAVFKTPVSTKISPQSGTTPLSQSPGDSLSDGTPKSGKKPRSKLSEAKMKDREAQRQKLKEEKLKAFEEKKKQKEQERVEKEKEKEKQRLEREAAKSEKDKQKKEEKEKKEKERLEKLQQKEDELKKKREEQEAKNEEKKKKDEEKRLKEEEKQKENEEKIKKEKKVKDAFQSFFIKTSTSPKSSKATVEPSGLFMPFQVKENTKLAPECRQYISEEQKNFLDKCLIDQESNVLYIKDLQNGKKTGKSEKTFPKTIGEDDVELLVHDSETVKKVTYKCKLLQFHMNYRPPYYGTYRKKSSHVRPRNPFKTDTEIFDYEYDSDDDWEEEEPGESLSDCDDEEEKVEEDNEDEEDDFIVPHGYLSDDEGVDKDDEEVSPELQEIKRNELATRWEADQNRLTKPVLPKIIGCFWEQATHVLQEEISKQLEQYKAVLLTTSPVPTSFNEPVKVVKGDNSSGDNNVDTPKVNPQRKPVPEEAMPDLIRLVHGNLMGIKKLIQEFRLFWKSKTTGEQEPTGTADMSMEVDNTENKAMDTSLSQENVTNVSITAETETDVANCAISKRQLEIKITAIAVREKRADFKKICWYVHDDILKQYNCEGLPIPSAWESLTKPAKTPGKVKPEETTPSGRKTPVPSITQFARPMSPSTIAAQHAAAQAKILAAQAEKKKEITVKEPEKMETSDTPNETVTLNKKVPVDQRKLTDFKKAFTSPQCKKRVALIPVTSPIPNSAVKPVSSPKPNSAVKTVSSNIPKTAVKTQKSGEEGSKSGENITVLPPVLKNIEKTNVELPKVNGLIQDSAGENSRDAIMID